tara:strand:- start:135 stop:1112 length:978 start_codon:yes stop_codon:yes gene_type:complete
MVACSGQPVLQQDMNEYQARLERVLQVDFPSPEIEPLAALPKSTIPLNGENQTIELTQFQQLQQCELGRLIAERNTALGKIQSPSQRFIYEHAFVQLLERCQRQIDGKNTDFVAMINGIKRKKLAAYERAWGVMTEHEQAIRLALAHPTTMMSADASPGDTSAVVALQYLTAYRHYSNIAPDDLEQQLNHLGRSRLPATLWRTQNYLTQHLSHLTQRVEPQLANVKCPAGVPSEQAKILRNVFYLLFIEAIQPVGSRLNSLHYSLMPTWQSWLESPHLSDPFKQYIKQQSVLRFNAYQVSVQQHVEMWQGFLARCNLSPVAPAPS